MLPPRNFAPKTRDDRLRSPQHRRWVASHLCVVWESGTCGASLRAVDSHHVRTAANAAMGRKPGDEWCISLCRHHHRELHNVGMPEFERRYAGELAGVSLMAKAMEFARKSPDRKIREAGKAERQAEERQEASRQVIAGMPTNRPE